MTKIKENILVKNIITLLITGAVAKIMGMICKVILTRQAGINTMSLYALLTPTLMMIISICQFSFPISISKLAAEGKYSNNEILINAYVTSFFIDLIVILFVLFSSNTISKMLHNESLSIAIKTICIIIPFVTYSSIQRGFLHGKEDMFIPSITNILEEIIKIFFIILLIPLMVKISNILTISAIILINIITEISSILIMKKTINKKYLTREKSKINIKIIKSILNISIPTTLVRLISSIGFFLEPIILTSILSKNGYSLEYVTLQYGIINTYVVPLLSMPTFFSISISSAILPNLTKLHINKKYYEFNSKLIKLLLFSMSIGIVCLTIILLFPKLILNTIYDTNYGINYLYIIGPFFILLYLQPTVTAAIQASGFTKKLLSVSICTIVIKTIILVILSIYGLGIKAYIYSMITGLIVTTILLIRILIKYQK